MTQTSDLVHTPRRKESDSKSARKLGLVLRGYREALGLSQTELARRVGVPRPSISLIEHGCRRPSASLLHDLADILHIKAEQLFLLSRPESKLLARTCLGSRASANHEIWRAFTHDKDLLARYKVQPNELRVLSKIRIIGELQHPRDFVGILTVIRQTLKA
jgi:transcriptional regulator with XRE-family HTH domain